MNNEIPGTNIFAPMLYLFRSSMPVALTRSVLFSGSARLPVVFFLVPAGHETCLPGHSAPHSATRTDHTPHGGTRPGHMLITRRRVRPSHEYPRIAMGNVSWRGPPAVDLAFHRLDLCCPSSSPSSRRLGYSTKTILRLPPRKVISISTSLS